jgi:hypothetical protein
LDREKSTSSLNIRHITPSFFLLFLLYLFLVLLPSFPFFLHSLFYSLPLLLTCTPFPSIIIYKSFHFLSFFSLRHSLSLAYSYSSLVVTHFLPSFFTSFPASSTLHFLFILIPLFLSPHFLPSHSVSSHPPTHICLLHFILSASTVGPELVTRGIQAVLSVCLPYSY